VHTSALSLSVCVSLLSPWEGMAGNDEIRHSLIGAEEDGADGGHKPNPIFYHDGKLVDGGEGELAAEGDEREYPAEMDCPITQALMLDPVTGSDGHTYERSAIQYWFDTGHNRSPVTNQVLDSQNLYANHALRKMIQYRRLELGKELMALCSETAIDEDRVLILIEQGAELNGRDRHGNTPVILCSLAGHIRLVEAMVTKGADMLKTNDAGESAITAARNGVASGRNRAALIQIVEEETEIQRKKIEEANNDRIERRRRREEQSSDGTIGDEEVDHRVAEERLFPNNIGNWRIDRGRGYFPSLFALQFQKMTTGENDGRQPITHIQQQYRLSRAVYALGFLLFACLIFF
jgi:hypothetical protein